MPQIRIPIITCRKCTAARDMLQNGKSKFTRLEVVAKEINCCQRLTEHDRQRRFR